MTNREIGNFVIVNGKIAFNYFDWYLHWFKNDSDFVKNY